ncbi:hypothetical protein NLG97_g5035 [Lecanicillium saksenae]|uniref:Uncharacterized protein n=1 Tax=Lecanicillium saksenae TaxID=468837 RepID=A0ACC1QTK0_9HYPO|nr:hypothetical protein NLG97_g5035 [Lecanicillium saksenae]
MESLGPLAPLVLAEYRRDFLLEVEQGHRHQVLLPQVLICSLVLPIIWIAIPHHDRPWFHRLRWVVFLFTLFVNCEQAKRISSTNVAWAVLPGLMGMYGTLLCFHHLIVTNPQRDAARIVRVAAGSDRGIPHANSDEADMPTHASGTPAAARCGPASPELPGRVEGKAASPTTQRLSKIRSHDGKYYYIWQRFPAKAPLLDRLGWAADLVLSLRGAGWNHSISVLPRPYTPKLVKDGDFVDEASVPSASKCGFEYKHSPSTFFWHRLKLFTFTYLLLDFLGTFMTKDPYFVVGREKLVQYTLPAYLASLPPWRIEAYRQLFSIGGAWAAVAAGYSLADMVSYGVAAYFYPSRNIPWIYVSAYGSFGEVFDRGLAGFWGTWWHQTFRMCFMSPATFLFDTGVIQKRTTIGNLVALVSSFAASGLLHGMGSLSSMPKTKLWSQPTFFLLQAVGVIVQQQLGSMAQKLFPKTGVILQRTANASFTLVWLYATAGFFNDDMAAMGIWTLEPVPFSFFRLMGFGFPGDPAWRWDSIHFLFRWHSGSHWWSSGLTIGE